MHRISETTHANEGAKKGMGSSEVTKISILFFFTMKKKIFKGIDLTCQLQERTNENAICKGVLTMKPSQGKFRFEEAIRFGSIMLNPKLYEGEYVSLVHRKDGRYQIHVRTFEAVTDQKLVELLVERISNEVNEAMKVMM